MASPFEEGSVGGFLFFIAGVSLASACLAALCAACKRREKSKPPSQDDEQVLFDEPAVPGSAAPSALGGSFPNLQLAGGSNSGVVNISLVILPQRDLPSVPCSPEVTYSNLSFPKRGEEIPCESRKVEGEESRNGPPGAETIGENILGPQAQTAEPSYACVVKKKKKKKKKTDGKQTWVEMGTPPETSRLTGTEPSPPTKALEEMYSVVCKEKRKKKAQPSEGTGGEKAPQAEVNQGHSQRMMVSQESNGIASDQSSSLPSATEPYYESVPCESWTKAIGQPAAEPAYESVDTYWNKLKKKPKASNKKMVAENLYETIDQVALRGQD